MRAGCRPAPSAIRNNSGLTRLQFLEARRRGAWQRRAGNSRGYLGHPTRQHPRDNLGLVWPHAPSVYPTTCWAQFQPSPRARRPNPPKHHARVNLFYGQRRRALRRRRRLCRRRRRGARRESSKTPRVECSCSNGGGRGAGSAAGGPAANPPKHAAGV